MTVGALAEDDWIECSISHMIKVGRDESWVKYGITTKVRAGESTDDARTRAIRHVDESVMQAIETTVETVREKVSE